MSHVVTCDRVGVGFSICSCAWRSPIYRRSEGIDEERLAEMALLQLMGHILTDCTWEERASA